MRRSIQIVFLITGAVTVSGCQILHSNSARLQAGLRIPQQPEPRSYALQQLEVGRAALIAHNYATAVAAFRNSALEPDLAAASHNGLAIAYAGMGRNDLAERYFDEAIVENPANRRYADNLLRLQRANFESEQARLARAELLPAPAGPQAARIMPGTAQRAALIATTPINRITAAGGPIVHIGAYTPLRASPRRIAKARRPKHDALPTVAVREVKSSALAPERATTSPNNPDLPSPAYARREVTLNMPRQPRQTLVIGNSGKKRRDASPSIKTTGRLYSDLKFAEIFAPYSGIAERTPILGVVSSAGLRRNTEPQWVIAQQASESSTLAVVAR